MKNVVVIAPRQFHGVMVSSTFRDLEEHRAALIKALNHAALTPIAMENDSAKPAVDVIDSSLQMVRDASAYIGVISRRYGQTPVCPERNPRKLSLMELEFDEAVRLGRPILLFLMSDNHPVPERNIELNAARRKKLESFRERAKLMGPSLQVHRVYASFGDLQEFTEKTIQSVAGLSRYLDHLDGIRPVDHGVDSLSSPEPPVHDPIPQPPRLYAEPPYVGSHQFVGRNAQLEILSDWATEADPHSTLLFDAIGGSGKSMLAWEWMTRHASKVRSDWAGFFWYSFYERGAIMSDFCRRALAYFTGRPPHAFRSLRTPELAEQLLHHCRARPWMIGLDGLERVLVAYHRFDAAEVRDEEASRPTDEIAHRDPCSAIRSEDDDLLRALAAIAPSKVLITSRLMPRVLLNAAGQSIPGVQRVWLPGLRPPEAEALLRSCGITGDAQAIQAYLKSHCDCHPLVIGVLAGLINDYLPRPGHFDTWAADPVGGGALNLATLDLVQRRNDILKAGLEALSEESARLLRTLALLSEAADYSVLSGIYPHLPSEPEGMEEPTDPKTWFWWDHMSPADRRVEQRKYRVALERWSEYERAREARRRMPDSLAAPQQLAWCVQDLVRRGLLQHDRHISRYDLHPVVRAVAAGALRPKERDAYGQQVVNYFSTQLGTPADAEELEDVSSGLHVVRTLLKMRRHEEACRVLQDGLLTALFFNLEANAEALSLLRPFFPDGWGVLPTVVSEVQAAYLANEAGGALTMVGEARESLAAYSASVLSDLRQARWATAVTSLENVAHALSGMGRTAAEDKCSTWALALATATDDQGGVFLGLLNRFHRLSIRGQWADADATWTALAAMKGDWPRSRYRPGTAEYYHAKMSFWRGRLSETQLDDAERLARAGRSRTNIRRLHYLRGRWHMERGEWVRAAESLREALSMGRAVRILDPSLDSALAIARLHLGELPDPALEAAELARTAWVDDLTMAELWLAIGDSRRARIHANAAYRVAWAEGEPYVSRYELKRSATLLETLGLPIPVLPPYDPSRETTLPWEAEVTAAIDMLQANKERSS